MPSTMLATISVFKTVYRINSAQEVVVLSSRSMKEITYLSSIRAWIIWIAVCDFTKKSQVSVYSCIFPLYEQTYGCSKLLVWVRFPVIQPVLEFILNHNFIVVKIVCITPRSHYPSSKNWDVTNHCLLLSVRRWLGLKMQTKLITFRRSPDCIMCMVLVTNKCWDGHFKILVLVWIFGQVNTFPSSLTMVWYGLLLSSRELMR